MTRINVVAVETLTRQHLIAEYREAPRLFGLVHKAILRGEQPTDKRNPQEYTLGKGHVRYFYNKLLYIANRQEQLVAEMKKRGYNPTHQSSLLDEWIDKIDERWWNDYVPTQEAIFINQQRINERLSKQGE